MNKILKNVFNVGKGNGLLPVTIVLSAPFVAISIVLLCLAWIAICISCIIGRRAAFDVLYEIMVKMGFKDA